MKRVVKWLLTSAFLSFVAAGGLAACGEAEELYDCVNICEAYGDCVQMLGQDPDITECINMCEDQADQRADFAEDAAACEECLEVGEECVDNFQCAAECAGVVPEVVF